MAGSRPTQRTDGSEAAQSAGAYAREALSQWGTAARLGAASVMPGVKERVANRGTEADTDRPPLRERLSPARTDKGGALGTAADKVLRRMGAPGKLASKVALGSRLTERLRGDDAGGAGDDAEAGIKVPVQEAINVAVPIALAYRLCTRFEEYPEFLDRAESADRTDDNHIEFVAHIRGASRKLGIEVFDARPNERIDWRSVEGIAHSGTVSFHELAPRLTHVELSVDLEPGGLIQRVARGAHLTNRAIRAEMNRFKAYAELYEDEGGDEELEAAEREQPDEREGAESDERDEELEAVSEEDVELEEEPFEPDEVEEEEEEASVRAG